MPVCEVSPCPFTPKMIAGIGNKKKTSGLKSFAITMGMAIQDKRPKASAINGDLVSMGSTPVGDQGTAHGKSWRAGSVTTRKLAIHNH